MEIENENFDQEGFEAFFRTHPNDATITEETPPDTNNDTDGESTGGTETNQNTTLPEGNEGNEGNEGSEGTQQQQHANNAQAQAFAQMRIANREQQKVLNQIAGVLGIKDTKDTNAVMQSLQSLATKAQAQKENIPEELLSRLNNLEAVNQEYQRQQAYLAAGRGFQTIKDKFGLDDNGLEAFAQELIASGINPYEQPVDIVTEYRNRHFDELIEQAVQRGIEQEAQRAAKAGTQSSTPNQSKGGNEAGSETKITSIAELNKWLDENKQ